VALMNLGEMCSGVAMMYLMPDDMRGIPTNLSMEYMKKARGVLRATCDVPAIQNDGTSYTQDVETVVRDAEGDVVAVFTARWQLSPKAEARGLSCEVLLDFRKAHHAITEVDAVVGVLSVGIDVGPVFFDLIFDGFDAACGVGV